ncbi:uncharacterized protein MELLADRAFT_115520 [Melampsora larici-populina 98AG31]|uniref:Heme haloperoxidase family profile domain-containing protein n=1 Tax=Melampsora larici-populina (strain 98AG31 / pathotype 3-4-7) TaxID=747676 RepID=F4RB84_MELLP|nr:uncharacterized protein MELLADRAFT_115520 [Melampsora larici-populina 98AG31]EGG10037.1 hypothetical protein MELLADRAFT_115520 [Melampsora larici-populina 98AG31]
MPSFFTRSFTNPNLLNLHKKQNSFHKYKLMNEKDEKVINIHEDQLDGPSSISGSEENEDQAVNQAKLRCPVMGSRAHHPYLKRSLGSPCPGISILINHSYLNPKDSRDPIPFYKLIYALVKCFNLSWLNAIFLTFFSIFLFGKVWNLCIDDLSLHDFIEHDASLSRFDENKGDYSNPSEERLEKFLKLSSSSTENQKDEKHQKFTLRDFSRSRRLAQYESERTRPMTKRGIFAGMGEVGLILSIFGKHASFELGQEPYIKKEWMKTIYIEERLPDEWCRPLKPVSVLKVHWFIKALKQLMV